MQDVNHKKTIENRAKTAWILPVLFALIIFFTPIYWIFANPPEFLSLEKRYRNELPAWDVKKALDGSWETAVDDWMSDKMPERDFLMGVYSYWQYFTGRQPAADVYKDGRGMLVDKPSVVDDEQLYTRLDTIIRFARSVDAKSALLVPPTAGYSAKEYLPEYLWNCYRDGELFEKISARLDGDVGFIDLRDEFLSNYESLFYRTDHHLNAKGAYLCYTAICVELGLEPFAPGDFDISTYDGFFGTTYSKSGLWFAQPDEIELWQPDCEVKVTFNDAAGEFDSLFFPAHLDNPDKYPVFLDSNHPLTIVENLSKEEGETLLIVKDSYANSMVPLLIGHYKMVIMVDLRYYRQGVSDIVSNYNVGSIVFIYSAGNIVTEPNILWLK